MLFFTVYVICQFNFYWLVSLCIQLLLIFIIHSLPIKIFDLQRNQCNCSKYLQAHNRVCAKLALIYVHDCRVAVCLTIESGLNA